MKFVYFVSFLLIAACSASNKQGKLQALPKARAYVEEYGQIVSENQNNYVNYLAGRLAAVLSQSSGKSQNFQIILLNTKKPIASFAGNGLILISRGIVISLQAEAELSFILAHEMAHAHLGHDPEQLMEEKDENTEIEADRLAVATISAAGYDPRLAIFALKNTYRYAAPYIINENDYPSLENRVDQLIEFIDSSGWKPPGIKNRREFKDFRQSLL